MELKIKNKKVKNKYAFKRAKSSNNKILGKRLIGGAKGTISESADCWDDDFKI